MPSTRRREALVGSLLLAVGIALALFGLTRAFVTEVGRPWDTRFGGPEGGPISGTITHEGGAVETFRVHNEEELRAFLERRERELTEEYGLGSTSLLGKVLLFAGLASVTVGVGALLWAAFGSLHARVPRRE